MKWGRAFRSAKTNEPHAIDHVDEVLSGCEAALRACLTIVTGLEHGHVVVTADEAIELRGHLMRHAATAQLWRERLAAARHELGIPRPLSTPRIADKADA
jgi:hypothetical protein